MSDNFKKKSMTFSLKQYDASYVINTIDALEKASRSVNDYTQEINALILGTADYWKGSARSALMNQIDIIWGDISDLNDGLGEIYDALMEVQVQFYGADDSLDQQLRECAHNDSKSRNNGSGTQGAVTENVPVVSPLTYEKYTPLLAEWSVTPITVQSRVVPNPLVPDLVKAIANPLPVQDRCMPSAAVAALVNRSMELLPQVGRCVAQAVSAVLQTSPMTRLPEMYSTLGQAAAALLADMIATPQDVAHQVMESAQTAIITPAVAEQLGAVAAGQLGQAVEAGSFGYTAAQAAAELHSTIGDKYGSYLHAENTSAQRKRLEQFLGSDVLKVLTNAALYRMPPDAIERELGAVIAATLGLKNVEQEQREILERLLAKGALLSLNITEASRKSDEIIHGSHSVGSGIWYKLKEMPDILNDIINNTLAFTQQSQQRLREFGEVVHDHVNNIRASSQLLESLNNAVADLEPAELFDSAGAAGMLKSMCIYDLPAVRSMMEDFPQISIVREGVRALRDAVSDVEVEVAMPVVIAAQEGLLEIKPAARKLFDTGDLANLGGIVGVYRQPTELPQFPIYNPISST
ncbi:MAG: hypothetical protein IKT57_01025 [Clostridia bacterium]|nr:hypothetical protein [Clostridia bacterium]